MPIDMDMLSIFPDLEHGETVSSFATYIADMEQYSLLSAEEQCRLANLAQDGNDEAREMLISSNLRLVVSIAKKYHSCDMPLEDRVQEGNIGLMKAACRFQPERGIKFSTYATWWIKQAIGRALYERGHGLIRLPSHASVALQQLRRREAQMAEEFGSNPSTAELAHALGWTLEKTRALRQANLHVASLDAELEGHEDTTLANWLEAPAPASSYHLSAGQREQQARVLDALMTLPHREREVLRLRYGIGSETGQGKTLEEVGRLFQVTRERIRQIEAVALRKLRSAVAQQKVEERAG